MNLHDVMPRLDEIDRGPQRQRVRGWEGGSTVHPRALRPSLGPWMREPWWNFWRKIRVGQDYPLAARVYLNGNGTDCELRFIVWDWTRKALPCVACDGEGRLLRGPRTIRGLDDLFGLKGTGGKREEPDADGLFPCLVCGGSGRVRAQYGAANDFCRTPDVAAYIGADARTHRLGGRGLAEPTKADVLAVLRWCGAQLATIYPREED